MAIKIIIIVYEMEWNRNEFISRGIQTKRRCRYFDILLFTESKMNISFASKCN